MQILKRLKKEKILIIKLLINLEKYNFHLTIKKRNQILLSKMILQTKQ